MVVVGNGTQTLDALRQEARTDTPERILEAAYGCIARVGLARTTVEDVAKAAGFSRQTIYRYYLSKDHLVMALVLREEEKFLDGARAAFARADDLRAGLEDAIAFCLRFAREHPLLDRLLAMDSETLLPYLTTRSAPVVDRAADVVSSEIRSKAWVRADILDEAVDALVRVILSHALSPSRRRIEDVAHDLAVMVTVALTGSETAGTKEVRR